MAEPVFEEGLLVDASEGEGPSFAPDFVITFPRTVAGEEDSVPTFSAERLEQLFDHMKMDMHASWSDRRVSACSAYDEDEAPTREMYPACSELEKQAAADGKVDLDAVQNAMVSDLVQYLHAWGCTTAAVTSCDEDELFVLISIGDPTKIAQEDPDVCAIAQHRHLRLQTVFGEENIEKLNMKQELLHAEEMYYPFNKKLSQDATTVLGIGKSGSFDLYRKYSDGIAGTHGSILRTVDRYRILRSLVLDSFFCLNQAHANRVINYYSIPHNLSKLEEFRSGKGKGVEDWDTGHKQWANFNFSTIFGGLRTRVGEGQPFSEIRDYFGERIAFYFLWLDHTARFTTLMIPLSLFMSAVYSLHSMEVRAVSHLFSAAFFSVSFAVYLKFWTRLQAYYAELWDMSGSMASTQCHDRSGYRGELKKDPLNMLRSRKEYPWVKARAAEFVSQAVALLFTLLVVLTVAGVYRLEAWIPNMLGVSMTTATRISSAIFVVQILVYQMVWDRLSYQLVELSNPRTEEDEKNVAVKFLFPLSIVSAYSNIIYHAFYKTWNVSCVADDCMKMMRPGMYQVVIPAAFMQFVFLVRPYVQRRYRLYSDARKRQKIKGSNSTVDRGFIEIQGKNIPFDLAAFNNNMNLMMIFLGYAILFGFVAPGILFVVSLTFWLKIRIDAFKLCSVYQRVLPSLVSVSGIGAWNSALFTISELGRWISLAVPIFNLRYLQADTSHSTMVSTMQQIETIGGTDIVCAAQGAWRLAFGQKLLLLFICKLGVDLVCKLIDLCISDVSSRTTLLRQKREAVEKRMAVQLMGSKLQVKPSYSRGQSIISRGSRPGTPSRSSRFGGLDGAGVLSS